MIKQATANLCDMCNDVDDCERCRQVAKAFEAMRRALRTLEGDSQGRLDGEEHATDCKAHQHNDEAACNCYINRSVDILNQARAALALAERVSGPMTDANKDGTR